MTGWGENRSLPTDERVVQLERALRAAVERCYMFVFLDVFASHQQGTSCYRAPTDKKCPPCRKALELLERAT